MPRAIFRHAQDLVKRQPVGCPIAFTAASRRKDNQHPHLIKWAGRF